MEFFLHLWDELDDLTAACRHVTVTTLEEAAGVSGAIGAALAAMGAFALSMLHLQ